MYQNVAGQVQNITISKPFGTKYGEKVNHVYTVNGEQYKDGFKKIGESPKAGPGDSVSFSYQSSQYGNDIVRNSMMVNGASQAAQSMAYQAPQQQQYQPPVKAAPYNDNRQVSIEVQSARNCAVQIVNMLLDKELLTGVKAAKQGNRDSVILSAVEQYTRELYKITKKVQENPEGEFSFPEDDKPFNDENPL